MVARRLSCAGSTAIRKALSAPQVWQAFRGSVAHPYDTVSPPHPSVEARFTLSTRTYCDAARYPDALSGHRVQHDAGTHHGGARPQPVADRSADRRLGGRRLLRPARAPPGGLSQRVRPEVAGPMTGSAKPTRLSPLVIRVGTAFRPFPRYAYYPGSVYGKLLDDGDRVDSQIEPMFHQNLHFRKKGPDLLTCAARPIGPDGILFKNTPPEKGVCRGWLCRREPMPSGHGHGRPIAVHVPPGGSRWPRRLRPELLRCLPPAAKRPSSQGLHRCVAFGTPISPFLPPARLRAKRQLRRPSQAAGREWDKPPRRHGAPRPRMTRGDRR